MNFGMKRVLFALIVAPLLIGATSCKKEAEKRSVEVKMATSVDSMSYAYGMELGRWLMETDSMFNIDMVCMGIGDAYRGETRLTEDQKRYAMLKYRYYDQYERVAAFEKQFLADLKARDRDYFTTTSGLTYKIRTSGDTKRAAKNSRDTIHVQFRMGDISSVIDTTYYRGDTLRIALGDMPKGVQEATRLIGRGGHIEAWVPSTLAFGSAGCDSLGVEPNTMLYYELKLIDVEKR